MIESFIITFREGFEAFLITFLVLGVVNKSGYKSANKWVYYGLASAVGVSILLALLIQLLSIQFEGAAEENFEGFLMIATAILLGFMIAWLIRFKINTEKISENIKRNLAKGSIAGIFLLVFVSVLREGVETVLFFTGLGVANTFLSWLGGFLGLACALVFCFGIFKGFVRLNFKLFFDVSTWLLIFIAAGMMSHGVHELNESGLIPSVVEHVYNVNNFMNEDGVFGEILSGLFGYNGNPSLTEIIAYFGYLGVLLVIFVMANKKSKQQPVVQKNA